MAQEEHLEETSSTEALNLDSSDALLISCVALGKALHL